MFQQITRKGFVQRDDFKLVIHPSDRRAAGNLIVDHFDIGELQPVAFLVRVGSEFLADAFGAAHESEMPAAVVHCFIAAVTYFLSAGKILETEHPRAVFQVRFHALAIHKMTVDNLLEFQDEGMIFSQPSAKTPVVKNALEPSRVEGIARQVGEKTIRGGHSRLTFATVVARGISSRSETKIKSSGRQLTRPRAMHLRWKFSNTHESFESGMSSTTT